MIFNTFKTCSAVFAALTVPRSRRMLDSGCQRRMCNKPEVSGTEPHAKQPTPAMSSSHGFRVPGVTPSDFDKKVLIWSGRFKTKEQIPDQISFEMLDAARNRVRVKACYAMIFLTVASCLCMVYLGKQAVGRNESLTKWNMEKKARVREEAQREREAGASVALATERGQ